MAFHWISCIILTLLLVTSQSYADHDVDMTSQCSEEIWVGILGNPGKSQPEQGGFKLEPGETESVTFSDEWVGRVWARTGCGVGPCETGDCGGGKLHCDGAGGVPPVTLLEVAFDGYMELDYYDISLVDGFNVKVSMTPKPGTYQPWSGSIYYCNTTSCLTDINKICPDESMKVFAENGTVIACKSACLAFNTDRYCCRGKWGSACHCPPFKYSEIFKKACPDAYSYAYDDKKSTFTCKSKPGTKTGFTITFC